MAEIRRQTVRTHIWKSARHTGAGHGTLKTSSVLRVLRWVVFALLLCVIAYQAFPLAVMSGDVVHGKPYGYDFAVCTMLIQTASVLIAGLRPRLAWLTVAAGIIDWCVTVVVFDVYRHNTSGDLFMGSLTDIIFVALSCVYWFTVRITSVAR